MYSVTEFEGGAPALTKGSGYYYYAGMGASLEAAARGLVMTSRGVGRAVDYRRARCATGSVTRLSIKKSRDIPRKGFQVSKRP